jgi:hypothetical protein
MLLPTGFLLLALFAVIVYRRKHRYCYFFAAYLAAQLAVNVIQIVRRASFESWNAWMAKEALYALLRVSILVELSLLIFRTLPRARRRVYVLLSITALVLLAVLSRRYDTTSPYTLAKDITSRCDYVTAWGLIALLVLVVWYRLPLHPFHKAILHGMLWLLLAHFAAVYGAKFAGGPLAGHLYNTVQIAILVVWLRAAWRLDPVWEFEETVVIRYLQPWRKR